jgi:transposase
VFNQDFQHARLLAQRQRVPDGSTTVRAVDYSLKRRGPLMRYPDDGNVPTDDHWVENRIRPVAIGRNNWLFAGGPGAGQSAAAVMSLANNLLLKVEFAEKLAFCLMLSS